MFDFSKPAELSMIFTTIGVIFIVIGVCIWLINKETKRKKEKGELF
ncbi:MAG: hypothetical protein PHW07_05435 [Sulfurospirillaceae bacterium]|nr:hypothetical protein [Sulfurospirillaceae bacterium]